MEVDLHYVETDKSIDEVKKILKEDVFGNYDVVDAKQSNAEFGIFLFQYNPNHIILKLDYAFYNCADVSRTLMQAFGKILQIKKYFIIGLKVDSPEAFVRLYQYMSLNNRMVFVEEKHEEDGSHLTPIAKEQWGIDLYDIWLQMQDKFNEETMRQRIKLTGGSDVMKESWIKKYGSMDNIDKSLCETMFFIAREDIEQYRTKPEDVVVEKVKLGKIVMEQIDGEPTIKRIIPNDMESKRVH